MAKLVENLRGYSQPSQREILVGLLDNDTIRNDFFLTGGTALSVFYLHHRTSIDLDFFNIDKPLMETIHLWITQRWPGDFTCQANFSGSYFCLRRPGTPFIKGVPGPP